jgi:hypothetical protein
MRTCERGENDQHELRTPDPVMPEEARANADQGGEILTAPRTTLYVLGKSDLDSTPCENELGWIAVKALRTELI